MSGCLCLCRSEGVLCGRFVRKPHRLTGMGQEDLRDMEDTVSLSKPNDSSRNHAVQDRTNKPTAAMTSSEAGPVVKKKSTLDKEGKDQD